MAIGVTLAGGIIAIERAARDPPKVLLGGLLGLIVSLLLGHLLTMSLAIPLIGGLDGFALRGLVHSFLYWRGARSP